jgi:predicted nucleotidyltransferase
MTTLHPDWLAFFGSLLEARVEFVVVGALAVAVHAEPRATDDLDVFVRPTLANARRIRAALIAFGFGKAAPSAAQLAQRDRVFIIGRKPLRIDILNAIDGVTFTDAWRNRVEVTIDGIRIPVIGRRELIANKQAAGRDKDRFDLAMLERIPPPRLDAPSKKAPNKRRPKRPEK